MKIFSNTTFTFLGLLLSISFTGCEKDELQPSPIPNKNCFIGFKDVPKAVTAGPTAYGANLYYGAPDQITTGYKTNLYEDTYIQFPVNYGSTFDADFNPVWGYSFYNGGVAVSDWYNKDDDSYLNQLSSIADPYFEESKFLVSYGNSDVTDPTKATLSDYDGCGHIYLTDEKGYKVENPGEENSSVSGTPKFGNFMGLMVTNTTYTYLSMLNGNGFSAPLQDSKGWYKVQFITFADNKPDSRPIDYVEVYLANFNEEIFKEIGYKGIINEWVEVNLYPANSKKQACLLVVNFVGSDMGDYGLNTPAYCAITNLHISIDR